MRLTIKGTGLIDCGGTVADLGKEEYSKRYHEKAASAHIKLGELEDIEDELGVSLATLFKALKDGIWSKGGFYSPCYLDAEPDFIPPNELEIGRDWYMQYDDDTERNYVEEDNDLCFYKHDYDFEVCSVRIKDYGKTWALTKKELKCDSPKKD